jgi:molybdopterin/thiamine biosynthesis adenylyltransferase
MRVQTQSKPDHKKAPAVLISPLSEDTQFPADAYGVVLGDGTKVICTTDRNLASMCGWDYIGELGNSPGLELHEPGIGALKHGIQHKRPVESMEYYDELISRTAGFTHGLLRSKHTGFVGTGASIGLIEACARTGVGSFSLWDLDTVELANIGRTSYNLRDIGHPKVTAAHAHILNINPTAEVHEYDGDFMELTDHEIASRFSECDIIVMGTDSQSVQLRGNEIGYGLGRKMLFLSFYEKACGGEIVVVAPPGPCYRCQTPSRFESESSDAPAVDGLRAESGLIFDCEHLDSIAGKLATALMLGNEVPHFTDLMNHSSANSLIFSKHELEMIGEATNIGRLFDGNFGSDGIASCYETLWFNPSDGRNPKCPVCGENK